MTSRRKFIKTSAACLTLPSVAGLSSKAWGQPEGLKVRKNLMNLPDDDPFFEQYGEAVKAMHALPKEDLRSWWGQATIHANYCKHGDLNFFSWHRPYITLFEEIAGALISDPSFTLHYWDWSEKKGIIPNPFYDNKLLNVTYWKDPGVYNGINWGPIDSLPIRALPQGKGLQDDPNRGGSFTKEKLESILKQNDFDIFTNMVEGQPHNTGHVIAGWPPSGKPGHIGDGLSPLDPIFWMHHTMVDYMWAKWQSAGNKTEDNDETYSNMFVDADGNFLTYTSEQARDFVKMGFTYEGLIESGDMSEVMKGVEISNEFQAALANQLRSAKPTTIGQTDKKVVARINQESSLSAKAPSLINELQSGRAFRTFARSQASYGAEPKRILAVLKNISWPEGKNTGLVVNIFVNCPYLSPTTPASDPHYAGTFSFFGSKKMMSGHHGSGHSIIIDITEPLKKQADGGRLDDDIKVQLMPLHASADNDTSATFDVKDMEIIAT
jgi:tyrosinase